jgi:hypothetical protein
MCLRLRADAWESVLRASTDTLFDPKRIVFGRSVLVHVFRFQQRALDNQ